MVSWKRPYEQWVKLNTDSNTLSNPEKIRVAGIIRQHNGEMRLAFATTLGEGTNNQAEILAAIFGMGWTMQFGYKNVIPEMDSQLLLDCVMLKAKPPCNIKVRYNSFKKSSHRPNFFYANIHSKSKLLLLIHC